MPPVHVGIVRLPANPMQGSPCIRGHQPCWPAIAFVKFEPRPADISVVEVELDDPTFVAAWNRRRLRRIRVICTDVGSGSPATSIPRVDT